MRDNLGGKVSNLIMMPGYAVLGATLVAYVCRAIFMCWAGRVVKRAYANELAMRRRQQKGRTLASLVGSDPATLPALIG